MATHRIEIIITARGTAQVQRDIRAIGTAADSTRRALSLLRNLLVVVAGARVLSNLAKQLDLFTELANRLRLVTNNAQELSAVQDVLFAISQRTRTEFEANVVSFQRLAQTTGHLKLTYEELFTITETVSTAVALSGASAQSAAAGMRQFGQALASGRLQGDELRSVVENLPFLANIIAKEFKTTGAALLALNEANPGIIKTDRILKAIRESGGEVSRVFQEMPKTISQGFTVLNNAITFFFGKLSLTTGAGQLLANTLIKIADNIDSVVLAITALASIAVLNFLAAQLTRILGTIIAIGKFGISAFTALASAIFSAAKAAVLFVRAIFLLNPLALLVTGLIGLFVIFQDEITEVFNKLGGFKVIFNNISAAGAAIVNTFIDNWKILPDAIGDLAIQAVNLLISNFESGLNEISAAIKSTLKIDLGQVNLGRIENQYAGAASRIATSVVTEFDRIKASDPAGFTKRKFEELQNFLKGFTLGGVNEKALRDMLAGLTPKGSGGSAGLDELTKGIDKLIKKLDQLVGSLDPVAKFNTEMTEAQNLLNEARERGIDVTEQYGLTEETLLKLLARESIGVGNAAFTTARSIELVNMQLERGTVTAEEAATKIRELRIAMLETQRTADAGFERAFLKLEDAATNTAAAVEEVFTMAVDGASDALISFAETGKFELDSLAKSFANFLLKLGTQQLFAGIGNMAGMGTNQGAGAGGGFNALGGLGTGIGSLVSSLFGFQNGGSFNVNGATSLASIPGMDNRLVAFRAQDGERVTVTPKGEMGPGGAPMNVVFNVTTPDADSFNRSRTQLTNRASAALSRASKRR